MESLTLLRLLAVYVALLCLDRLAPSGLLRSVANAFAVAMPLILLLDHALRSRPLLLPKGLAIGLGLLFAGLVGSWLANDVYNVADFSKFMLAPVFAVLGYNLSRFDTTDAQAVRTMRLLGLALLTMPLALIVLQRWVPPPGETEISIFANRNNAALYFVVLSNLLFLLGARVPVVVAFLAVIAFAFSTLGVLMAVLLALVISLSLRRYAGAYLAAIALGLLLVYGPIELPIGERVGTLFEGIAAVSELGLWGELDRLSYLDLYRITGNNTDLSFFFRIKHWEDLYAVWSASGPLAWLLGLGVGSSVFHTDIGLVPHNDYVRFLIETGLVGLAGFAGVTGWLAWTIGRRSVLMSTAAVAIYFVSENLVDNFAAMSLYYYFAGYWARHAAATVPAAGAAAADADPAAPGADGLPGAYGVARQPE